MQEKMTYFGHLRAVLSLGLPLVAGQVAQFAISLTDTIMLGWYDLTVLGGQVLGAGLFFVLFIVGSGFAMAVSPLVASAAGAGEFQKVRRATRMGMWASIIYALVVLPAMIWAEPILLALGQDPKLAEIAQDYCRIAGIGILPGLIVAVLQNYFSALERAQIVMWVTIFAVGSNALINYALIFGNFGAPEMGVKGAAIASVSVSVISVLLLSLYARFVTPENKIFTRFWRSDPGALSKVVMLGLPIGLTMMAEAGLFSASTLMMGWIGEAELVAHGIALNIAAVAFMVQLGLSRTATVRAGRALGRQDKTGLQRGAKVVLGVSLAVICVSIVLFLVIPEALLSAFIAADDPQRAQVVSIGIGLLAAAALFQLGDAVQVVALGLLRGVQDMKVPMIIAGFSYWVIGAPVSYLLGFPLGLGGVGIWLGLALGLGVAAVLLLWRFWTHSVHIDRQAKA